MFFNKVGKGSKEKHIWTGVTLPDCVLQKQKRSKQRNLLINCVICVASLFIGE